MKSKLHLLWSRTAVESRVYPAIFGGVNITRGLGQTKTAKGEFCNVVPDYDFLHEHSDVIRFLTNILSGQGCHSRLDSLVDDRPRVDRLPIVDTVDQLSSHNSYMRLLYLRCSNISKSWN